MGTKRDLTGRVTGVNEKGVKIDASWYNFSNFYTGDREPSRGVAVSVELDSYKEREYLNKLVVIGSALPDSGGNSSASPAYGRGETNERIARQVALKAAVDYHTDTSSLPPEIIATARIFEKFLAEPYGVADVEAAA